MPFPKRLLLDGEVVALDLRPHWWFFAGPLSAGVPVLALLYGTTKLNGDVRDAALWACAVLALVWALWLAQRLISWQTTHFVVTSDRLIFRSGILAKHSRDIPLEKVEFIDARQTFFERIIGAGDLVIKSGDEQAQAFSDIPRPDAVQREINTQMESNQVRAFGGGAARTPSIPEQIAALADLVERGAISQAEYERKKAELLDRL